MPGLEVWYITFPNLLVREKLIQVIVGMVALKCRRVSPAAARSRPRGRVAV